MNRLIFFCSPYLKPRWHLKTHDHVAHRGQRQNDRHDASTNPANAFYNDNDYAGLQVGGMIYAVY